MKNLIFTIISISFITSAFSQEAADKKYQAGIILGSGLNFTNPASNFFERKGTGTDLSIGMNLNI